MQSQLIEQLMALRLRGMASALEESLTALSQKKLAPTSWLSQLLQAEVADRQARSYQYQLRLANFPMPRDLDSFDFRESAVNETQIRQLHTGEYLSTARNIVFVGGTGTGKTHLVLGVNYFFLRVASRRTVTGLPHDECYRVSLDLRSCFIGSPVT